MKAAAGETPSRSMTNDEVCFPITGSPDHPITRSRAFLASAHLAQVIPGVNAARVAVIPADVERIAAHRFDLFWLGRLFIHRQQGGRRFGRLPRLAMMAVAVFRTGRARAGIAQPLEGVVRAMAVVPLDVDTGSGGDVDLDRFGVDDSHTFSI